jgi:membrane-associated phospholipid phosphatase
MMRASMPAGPLPAPAPARDPNALASAAYRWTIGLSLAALQSAIYFGIGHAHFARSTELLRTWVDDGIPFWPWTVWCYLPFYAAIFVMAIGGFRHRALFNRAAVGVAVVMALGATGHLLVRAEFPRPVLHPPYSNPSMAFLAWVHAIDAPGNVFPSLHVAQTSLLSLLLIRDRPVLGRVALVMATMLALSTMTIKQHFVADVLSGYLLAFIGRAVALRGLARAAPASAAASAGGRGPRS